METSLRPMTLGEILDRTAQLYRQNFLLFAGIASIYAGVLLIVGLAQIGATEWMTAHHMTKEVMWMSGISIALTYGAMFIFGGIAVAANNRAVAWLHLGEPATIRGAYQSILPKVWRYLWLGLLKVFFAWSPLVIVYAGFLAVVVYFGINSAAHPGTPPNPANSPQMLAAVITMGVLALLFLPALIYGILMGLRYELAVPACVVEELKARPSIKRSILLTKGARGRIFILWILVIVIEVGIALVTQSFFVIAAVKSHNVLPVGLRILQQLLGFCSTTFVAPILATGLTLFYYDQRIRGEGYDIEWMMQAAGMTAPAPAMAAPATAVAAPVDAAGASEWMGTGEMTAAPESHGRVAEHGAEAATPERGSDWSAVAEPGSTHE